MRARSPVQPVWLATLVTACACLSFAGLTLVSHSKESERQAHDLERRLSKAPRLKPPSTIEGRWPAGSVCDRPINLAAEDLSGNLASLARDAALEVSASTADVDKTLPKAAMSSAVLRLKASGSHEEMVDFLVRVAEEKPALFVEAVDLVPRGGNLQLDLKGRVWCRPPRA